MTPRFEFTATPLAGLTVVHRKPLTDQRGTFERMFCKQDIEAAGFQLPIVQINRTATHRKGSVRGMHFQFPPHSETKMVSCLKGRVFDVAVDLRRGSPTYLCWHAEELSADNCKGMLISAGFAHGLQTLVDDCELLYFHSTTYTPHAEGGVNPRDPRISIAWPLPISDMSQRDRFHPALTDDFKGLHL
jgi:dTDP-4-dehydrorhamnose 3,5-epimerase